MAKQSLTMPPFDEAKNGPKQDASATLNKRAGTRAGIKNAGRQEYKKRYTGIHEKNSKFEARNKLGEFVVRSS
jgi:hypothetical protein